MFVEIRRQGKKSKYYLVHSFRIGSSVRRISRYLGSDLDQKTLEKLKSRAEAIILEQIKEHNPLEFELTPDEIKSYKDFEKKIEIEHFHTDWNRFTKEFVYNTNAIEGSTVEYPEVKKLIDKKELPRDNDEIETVEVAKAIEYLKNYKGKLSINLIKKLHFICFGKTKHFAGEFRNVEVVVKDGAGNIIHQGAPAQYVKNLLEDLVRWYNNHAKRYPPLLIAALLHNQFEKIHPFQDGNGRVGRLLLNYSLLFNKYPPLNIGLKDRMKYYEALQKFDRSGDIKSTLKFLISQYRKQYR